MFGYMLERFKINKKNKLIELFAGIGSQAMALRDSSINYECHKICEWEVNAMASYKEIHMPDDDTDYSADYSKEQLVKTLVELGISSDGKKPMDNKAIARKPEKWLREIYNNIKATHNLVDITKVHADDLDITDTDKYHYFMTYSFPCQDLSKAGKQKGMAKGSGTRSSMLWEVERILGELWEQKKLPQVLLMENVPDVIGTKNIAHFNQWYAKLEAIGYQSYYKILNAKDYGIPQNRERCFMISILGDYSYEWPKPIPLKLYLKDLLEPAVDEKYYISESMVKSMLNTPFNSGKLEYIVQKKDVCSTLLARDYKSPKCVIVGETDFGNNDTLNRIYDSDSLSPTLGTMQGGHQEPKILDPLICASRGRNPDNPKSRKSGEPTKQMIEVNMSGCSNTLTSVQKDNYVIEPQGVIVKEAAKQGYAIAEEDDSVNLEQPNSQTRRGRVGKGVAQTLTTSCNQGVVITDTYNHKTEAKEIIGTITANTGTVGHCGNFAVHEQYRIRKLTPLECWRLMGFTDHDYYRAATVNSNSQLYKQAGNSIVKHVLMAIFKQMM
jgi:DNA (cytosine-5)-methyltransferase 1